MNDMVDKVLYNILLIKIIFFHLFETEGTAEAQVACSTVSPAAAGVPLGKSGFGHTP